MEKQIRVVQFGLGPIGIETAKVIDKKSSFELVGGIDIDPDKAGRDLGEVCGLGKTLGRPVSADADALLHELKPDVVLHTTSSFLDKVEDQLLTCIRAGAHVVSSTEELLYPFERDADFSARIDAAARRNNVAVVGTGVNPGFAMDILPLTLTGVCTEVKSVRIERVSNASERRQPLQKKVGAGMSEAEFRELAASGGIGHIGLVESLLAVAAGLDWKPETVEEKLEPILAEKDIHTDYFHVRPGQVAGIHHTCTATIGGKTVIDLDLKMYLDARDPHDSVFIEGTPPLSMRIDGGIFGDTATVAALVNTAARIHTAAPGLRTMLDLTVPRAVS